MSLRTPLFRQAALDAHRPQYHGAIIMAPKLSHSFLTVGFLLCASLLFAFTALTSYTKRVTVRGQVVASAGVVKLYAPQPGIILEQHVVDGQHVVKGDVLYVLSTDRQSAAVGAAQAAISEQVRVKRDSLLEQLTTTERLWRLERDALLARVAATREEIRTLEVLCEGNDRRAQLAEDAYENNSKLAAEGFVPTSRLKEVEAQLLEQRGRADASDRELIVARRNLQEAESELLLLAPRYETQIGSLKRELASVEQELADSESRRQYVVVATEDGIATAVTAQRGQIAEPNRPLLSIIPRRSKWQAQLYAPSRSIGFIRSGDRVRIRYQAFPYQKFGQYDGTVAIVASTALSSLELTGTGAFSTTPFADGEPLYRITVDLPEQTVAAPGRQLELHAGMLLEADLLQETRRLYEWILEPLYGLSRRVGADS